MIIKELKKSNRDREYKLYPEHIRDSVVYHYLFEGQSHRWLDANVIGEDAAYSRGYMSMGILHHLGLVNDHKSMFKDMSVLDAVSALEEAEVSDFKRIIMALMRYYHSDYSMEGLEYFVPSSDSPRIIKSVGTSQYTDGVRLEKEYSEGRVAYRKHKTRERNPNLIKRAKERFMKNNDGRLYCEACGFDFFEIYGERGKEFIEGHHTRLVSELSEGDKTRVEDIAMLCSNCHRMVHRKPILTVDELKKIMKTLKGTTHL